MSPLTLIQYLKFKDLLESLCLEHTHGHTLDLVITRKMDNTMARPPRVCRYLSDPAAVHCDININKPAFQKLKYFVQEGDGGRHGLSQVRSCIDLSKSGQDNPS